MSRTLTEGVVSTRNARAKLKPGIHWRGIDADVHLGYRKGNRGGRWMVRWYVGQQKYQQETIGSADDAVEADGVNCLTFEQAKAAAARLVAQKRADAIADAEGPAPTIRSRSKLMSRPGTPVNGRGPARGATPVCGSRGTCSRTRSSPTPSCTR